MIYFDELGNFRPIREDHLKDVEKFTRKLIDVAVTNLKEAKRFVAKRNCSRK